jgi:hypothetical protein
MRPLAAKARPLVTKRDYEVARKLVLRYVRQSEAERDWERTKALLREIAQYERSRKGEDQGSSVVIWAQGVFVNSALYAGPRRREDRPAPGQASGAGPRPAPATGPPHQQPRAMEMFTVRATFWNATW